MEIIQQKFRLNKLNKLIRELNITTKDKSFDEFITLIQDKNILKTTSNIIILINDIANYGNKIPIINRVFLSSFVISSFPNDVLSKSTGPIQSSTEIKINEIILEDSHQIVNNFTSLHSLNKAKQFHKMLSLYNDTFKAWKQFDLKSLVNTLTTSYYELETIIQSVEKENKLNDGYSLEDKNEYIYFCRKHQEDIIDKIIFLNGQEHFNKYKHEEISLDDSLKQHIQDTLYQAYWDILKKELDSEPPVFNQLLIILSEIRDLFCKFVPNRQDIQQEIKDKIDPDLIKNMAEHNAFDDDNLYNLAMYMISLVQQFQPPVMDKKVEEWKDNMIYTLKQPLIYSDFLCIFLKSLFNMIQEIIKYIF